MFNILGIEVTDEENEMLMQEQAKGKELKVVNGKIVAVEHEPTQKELTIQRIAELKQQIAKYKEDVEQVELFGMERDDYAEKKEMCKQIVLELRQLEVQLRESNDAIQQE